MHDRQTAENGISKFIVTIDGPAGSGKSTTASLLAERLGLLYLDTGAMYRAVTYAALRAGIDPGDESGVAGVARSIALEFRPIDGKPTIFLDGENVETQIRGPEVSRCVSLVSRHTQIRFEMVRLQRRIGAGGGIVVEGRDAGSVVFPFAHVKVYLVADIEARAKRRVVQLQSMGIEQHPDEIRHNILKRDSIDSGREHSPLVRPPGSILVDTSNLTIEQQVTEIETYVRREANRLAALGMQPDNGNPFSVMNRYYRISQRIVRFFFTLLFGLRTYGTENLRFRENFIFASNHLSFADPPLVGCTLNREVHFVAKKELFGNRLFAWLIRKYHAISIDRDEVDRRTLQTIMELLQAGNSVLFFPEGTRSRNGTIGELKSGLGFIAMHTGVSIVPIFTRGSNRLLDCMLRRARLEVHIGAPIRIAPGYASDNRKQAYRVLSTMVRNEMRLLQDEAKT